MTEGEVGDGLCCAQLGLGDGCCGFVCCTQSCWCSLQIVVKFDRLCEAGLNDAEIDATCFEPPERSSLLCLGPLTLLTAADRRRRGGLRVDLLAPSEDAPGLVADISTFGFHFSTVQDSRLLSSAFVQPQLRIFAQT